LAKRSVGESNRRICDDEGFLQTLVESLLDLGPIVVEV